MVRVFVNGPGYWSSILGRLIQETQKWYSILPCLGHSILKYGSRVSGETLEKELRSFLPFGVVAIEKGASGCPRQWSVNLLIFNLIINLLQVTELYLFIYTYFNII